MSPDAEGSNLFTLIRDLGVRLDRQTDTLTSKIDDVAEQVHEQIEDVNTAKTAAHKDLWAAVGHLTAQLEALKQAHGEFKGRIYGALAALSFVVTGVTVALLISDHL